MALLMLATGCGHESYFLGSPDHRIDIPPDTVDPVVPDTMPPDVPTECADSDGDGVCDYADRCPGHDDRMDADGDTVPDGCDACLIGDDRRDADGDGVPDACDCDYYEIVCDPNASCVETGGAPTCVCNPGYEGDGYHCTDVNECAIGTHVCDTNATCTNTPGSYICTCNEGYEGDGYTCVPIDHCARGTDLCDVHATCTFTGPGTYTCTCNPGYTGDGFTCTPDSVRCDSYSEDFVNGSTATAQCTIWDSWRAGLSSSGYTSVTMSGTYATTGITCSDPTTAQAIADAVRTETSGRWSCDGHTWDLCGSRYSGELWIDSPSLCSGDNCPNPGYIIRPCISNANWGGVNTNTCTSNPSQNMTIDFCTGGSSGGATGTARRVDGTWIPIQYVLCGSGSPGTCTASVAKSSCTSLGQKVVSHASDGTTEVLSLGATNSCLWSVSYFTVDVSMPPTSCLAGISNLEWTGSCCPTTQWHGNTLLFGTVSTIFGYVNVSNSGYVSTYPNVEGERWGCMEKSRAAENLTGCTTQYVACTR